ncbi:MAG: hypothetical protein N4A48_09825 [Tepidibacter sp.]|uniref:hypothetical protein n=1 Tax=Tepidibacter sp. TaxID=2529387 RepID=UPI0025FDD1F1|nr:hypothetical protein [Tepidibacter sp.]MCT4509038.1 hypothetical protein [Tepidibacter sp.]
MIKISKKIVSSITTLGLLATISMPINIHALDKNKINEDFLNKYGISQKNWESLEYHSDTIKSVIEQENLSKKEAQNLVNTWIEKYEEKQNKEKIYSSEEEYKIVDGIVVDNKGNKICPTPHQIKSDKLLKKEDIKENTSPKLAKSSYGYDIVGNPNEHTGSHWTVIADKGYNKATGYFNLPKVRIEDEGNTFPYAYFGEYGYQGKYNPLVSDAGIHYLEDGPDGRGWYSFINFNVWSDKKGEYKQDWDQDLIRPSSDKVYMMYEIKSYSGYDKATVTIVDTENWSTLQTYTSDTRDLVPEKDFINSSYSNLEMTRETTLAQVNENLNDGSYVHNAEWSNVYLYSPSSYHEWTNRYTSEAGYGTTQEHADTVTVNSCSEWYEDDVDIDY